VPARAPSLGTALQRLRLQDAATAAATSAARAELQAERNAVVASSAAGAARLMYVCYSVDGDVVRRFDRSLASGLDPEIVVLVVRSKAQGLSIESFFDYCVFDANTTAVYAELLRSLNGSHPSTRLKLGLRIFAMPCERGERGLAAPSATMSSPRRLLGAGKP